MCTMFWIISFSLFVHVNGDRRVCDFNVDVVKDCDAVITKPLNLKSAQLKNVNIDLLCERGVFCINILNVATVNMLNTNIKCSKGTFGIKVENSMLSMGSSSISSCDVGVNATSFSTLSFLNSTFSGIDSDNFNLAAVVGKNGQAIWISDCTFKDNGRAVMSVFVDKTVISNTDFYNNRKSGPVSLGGSALHINGGNVSLDQVRCEYNSFFFGEGGTIFIKNAVEINILRSKFNHNSIRHAGSISGGGLYALFSGPLTVLDTEFSNNTAAADYGGAYGGGMAVYGTHTKLVNVTFNGNTAKTIVDGGFSSGGGLFHKNGNISITDSLFTENTATHYGGMMYCTDSPGKIFNTSGQDNTVEDVVCDKAELLMDKYSICNIPTVRSHNGDCVVQMEIKRVP